MGAVKRISWMREPSTPAWAVDRMLTAVQRTRALDVFIGRHAGMLRRLGLVDV